MSRPLDPSPCSNVAPPLGATRSRSRSPAQKKPRLGDTVLREVEYVGKRVMEVPGKRRRGDGKTSGTSCRREKCQERKRARPGKLNGGIS